VLDALSGGEWMIHHVLGAIALPAYRDESGRHARGAGVELEGARGVPYAACAASARGFGAMASNESPWAARRFW
jgi:hypothetical protein